MPSTVQKDLNAGRVNPPPAGPPWALGPGVAPAAFVHHPPGLAQAVAPQPIGNQGHPPAHQPNPALPAQGMQTLFTWARDWSAPDILPWIERGADDEPTYQYVNHLAVPNPHQGPHPRPSNSQLGNTQHRDYSDKPPTMMEQWNIDLLSIANDAEVSQVLRMPFITNGPAPFMPGHYRPILNPQVDTSPPAMFNHEAGLTSRLDQYVFLDLERALVQIAYWSSTIPQYRPAPGVPWVPLFSLPGTYARLYAKPNADEAQKQAERKLPDRCTLEDNSDPPPFGMKGPPTRCVGEIKPSYKFSGLWLLDYIPAVNANIPVQGMQAPWKLRQTSLVLAQVTYYMRRLGLTTTAGGLEGSCTYGYIITDKEVVLLKRLNARAGLGNTRALAASKPFPLRQVPQGAVSGMLALVYIHLLAGVQESWECPVPNE